MANDNKRYLTSLRQEVSRLRASGVSGFDLLHREVRLHFCRLEDPSIRQQHAFQRELMDKAIR